VIWLIMVNRITKQVNAMIDAAPKSA